MIYEVCCGCTDDAVNAFKGGADRIELNSALFLGGLTPSLGTLLKVKELVKIPVMAMVRPREGGFCYTDNEYETMKADAALFLENGADGLVFGFLNADGTVDEERTGEFHALCRKWGRESVFSRAVDVTPDIIKAVETLSRTGITRILTSGGEESAIIGCETIKSMLAAAGDMQVLPGGGITPENVNELVLKTGVDQVHGSARKLCYDTSVRANSKIFFGGKIDGRFNPEDEYKVTDPDAVRKMKETMK